MGPKGPSQEFHQPRGTKLNIAQLEIRIKSQGGLLLGSQGYISTSHAFPSSLSLRAGLPCSPWSLPTSHGNHNAFTSSWVPSGRRVRRRLCWSQKTCSITLLPWGREGKTYSHLWRKQTQGIGAKWSLLWMPPRMS